MKNFRCESVPRLFAVLRLLQLHSILRRTKRCANKTVVCFTSLLYCLNLLHGLWYLHFYLSSTSFLRWYPETHIQTCVIAHIHLHQHPPPSLLPESQSVVSLSREMRLGFLNSLSINATAGNFKHAERTTRHHPLPPEICLPFHTSP